MKPTTEILANMSRNSSAHHDEVFTRVYRYLLRPDLYFAAYKRLQANHVVLMMTPLMDSAKEKSTALSKR